MINAYYPLVICYIAIEHIPYIVDLPMKKCVFPQFLVCLPEGFVLIQ